MERDFMKSKRFRHLNNMKNQMLLSQQSHSFDSKEGSNDEQFRSNKGFGLANYDINDMTEDSHYQSKDHMTLQHDRSHFEHINLLSHPAPTQKGLKQSISSRIQLSQRLYGKNAARTSHHQSRTLQNSQRKQNSNDNKLLDEDVNQIFHNNLLMQQDSILKEDSRFTDKATNKQLIANSHRVLQPSTSGVFFHTKTANNNHQVLKLKQQQRPSLKDFKQIYANQMQLRLPKIN